MMQKNFFVCYIACFALFLSVIGLRLFGVSQNTSSHSESRVSAASVVPLLEGHTLSPPPVVSAKAAALIDAASGALLFEKNSSERLPMASTTKIMTAYVILNSLPLDRVVTVPKEATHVEGSSIYLRADETITVETLLYGLLLESGNDAAHTLAVACAGSVPAFAEQMNSAARDLGLQNTCFANPHGLTASGHSTTAYELARITAAAMKNPTFKRLVSTKKKLAPSMDGELTRLFLNHNKMLRLYDGAVGVKTGFTKAAGRCLVSAAERDGRLFIAVTLDDGNDWKDHTAMLDYAAENFDTLEIAAPGQFGVYRDGVRFSNTEGVYLTVPKGTRPMLSYHCELSERSGTVRCYTESAELGRFSLTPDETAAAVSRKMN